MYSTIYGKSDLKKDGKIYGVKNNHGNISVLEFDCYRQGKFFYHKSEDGEKYDGMDESKFCSPYLNKYYLDRDCEISFMHTDKNILIEKWNAEVERDKINKILILNASSATIKNFDDIIAYAEKMNEKGVCCETVVICTKEHPDKPVAISLKEKDGTYYISHTDDYTSEIKDFVEDYEWDEGYSGYGTIDGLNKYLATYQIDLTRTFFIEYIEKTVEEIKQYSESTYNGLEEHENIRDAFLAFDLLCGAGYKENHIVPLSEMNYEEGYVYELVYNYDSDGMRNKLYIVAHKIVSEDETKWKCEDKEFLKTDFGTEKIYPYGLTLFYGTNPEEIIKLYNDNLDKFKI